MIKEFVKRRHLVPLGIWIVLYLAVFLYLEICPPQEVHIIHCALDDQIPYIQAFVYPYVVWFPYICVCTSLSLRNLSDKKYKEALLILASGMTIFLIACFAYPSGLTLREGIVYDTSVPSGLLLQFVQGVDVPKNVFPSMHVYVTIAFQYALELQKDRLPAWGIWLGRIVAVLIVLSTVFVKQHSVLDVAGSVVMFAVIWGLYQVFVKRKA